MLCHGVRLARITKWQSLTDGVRIAVRESLSRKIETLIVQAEVRRDWLLSNNGPQFRQFDAVND
jgi:hypothetical protein